MRSRARQLHQLRRETYAAAVALLLAMAVGSLLIMSVGESPARVYWTLLANTWGDATGISQVLFRATPLIFTGLAVSLAFRAGLFNIGGEGQATAGAMVTALVAAAFSPGVSSALAWPVAIAAGAAAGALVGAIPGVLKAATGAHEVINTIMLNFVVGGVVLYAGNRGLFVAGTTHSPNIPAGAALPRIGASGSALNASFLLALLVAFAVWIFLSRSRLGLEWRAVGANASAAEASGVSLARTTVWAMTISGAIAGLVGANEVLGYKPYYEHGSISGVGFMGIAVALLGRNHPAGVVVAAIVFGTLAQGGFAVSGLVPKEIVDVLRAVVILAVVATSAEVRRRAVRAGGDT